MSDAKQQESPEAVGLLRRRSQRIPARVPISARAGGDLADGFTAVVNRHGALVLLAADFSEESELMIRNRTTGQESRCRIVWCGDADATGSRKYGIELLEDLPEFWGIDFSVVGEPEVIG